MSLTSQGASERVELRCRKCLHRGRPHGRLFDTVWFVNDRIHGIPITTDLEDEIKALDAGRAHETPPWMGSTPYINECSRCGNRPELKPETLMALVREALGRGESVIYL
jgi:hypothetical protein